MAGFCTWDRATLEQQTDWRIRGSRGELWKGPGGYVWQQVEHEPAVPWQPGGTTLSWGHQAQHHNWAKKGLSCSALSWGGLTSSAGGRFGCHNIKQTLDYWKVSKGGTWRWQRALRGSHTSSHWGHLVCSAWRRLRTDLPAVCSFLVRGRAGAGTDLFYMTSR